MAKTQFDSTLTQPSHLTFFSSGQFLQSKVFKPEHVRTKRPDESEPLRMNIFHSENDWIKIILLNRFGTSSRVSKLIEIELQLVWMLLIIWIISVDFVIRADLGVNDKLLKFLKSVLLNSTHWKQLSQQHQSRSHGINLTINKTHSV